MSGAASMIRLETFARLHAAEPGDMLELTGLSERLCTGAGAEKPVWSALLQAGDAHVHVATECQLVVGAIVCWHHKGADVARLAWLGVEASARRRGIGRLLLEAHIARVALAGAETLVARTDADDLRGFFVNAGFAGAKGGEFRLPLGAAA